MIYTVTLNPAVDYVIHADKITAGEVNRLRSEEIFFGGKGINVSLVLRELSVKSQALGFVAGFTGDAIEQGVREAGIDTDFVRLESGFSRINVKIKSEEETDLNGAGPDIPQDKVEELFLKLDKIQSGDTIVLAGSIPASLPRDFYEKILEKLENRQIRAVVDADGDLLRNALKYKPFLVKPNSFELGALFGRRLETLDEVIEHAKRLRDMGAKNVLVSMAGDGAVLVSESGEVITCGVCRGKVKNSVGAGDSMVAGFLAGYEKGCGYALKLGTAAGGATAFSEGLGSKEEIFRLLGELE